MGEPVRLGADVRRWRLTPIPSLAQGVREVLRYPSVMSIWDRDQCQTYWGSHGCKLARGHDGEHQCQDLDEDQPHDRINRDGIDPETGFRWDLYGDDASPLVQ